MAQDRTTRTPRRRPRPRAAADAARARRAGTRLARLVRIMAALRAPDGCPWDRDQTHESLRPFLIEEAYEALDAIDAGRPADLAEELGDVLFQCVFHSQIGAEAGTFDLADAIDAITAKLIRRHPHVFTPTGRPLAATGRRRLRTPGAVLEQWEAIKARERDDDGRRAGVLTGVPRALPALVRANEIGSRVASVGFDWPAAADVVDKIDEEVAELRAAVTESRERAAEEFGDLLFSIANLARKIGIEPESALRSANDKFTRRFEGVEARLAGTGRSIHDATLDEMEAAWQAVKQAAAPAASSTGRSGGDGRSSSSPPRGRRRSRAGSPRRGPS
jgi:MazG family protein